MESNIGEQYGGRGGTEAGRSNMAHVASNYLGTEHNTPLAYAPGTELHRPIMSKLGGKEAS